MITAIDRLPGADPGADVAVLGAERRRRVSDALGEAYSPGTREVYRSHWARWTEWAEGLGVLALPAAPVHVAAFLTDRAEEGCRPATLRAALAAIAFAHRTEGLDSPTEDEGVVTTMRGLSRMLGRAQRQAPGLTRDRLAAVRAVACLPRRGRGGRLETPEYARRRGLVDIALASVMGGRAAAEGRGRGGHLVGRHMGAGRVGTTAGEEVEDGPRGPRDGAVPVAPGRVGPAGDPCGGLHRRRPGLRAVGAADPPPASGGRQGGGPGRGVLRAQRPGWDGTGPRGVWDRAARPDDGGEVVEPDDAGPLHAVAAGGSRRRGQVLRGVGRGRAGARHESPFASLYDGVPF